MAEPQKSSGSSNLASFSASKIGWIFAAALGHLALVSAAVETFLSQSAVRWWVAGAVALYIAAVIGVWRAAPSVWKRLTPTVLATSGVGLFLVLLAATAWLPGGQTEGLRLLGQTTPVLLAAVSALAVALSGLALWRLRILPAWVRYALAALSVYGAVAFVIGLVTVTPYASLFHGHSFWAVLPEWLQGAFVGGLLLIPLAIVAQIMRIVEQLGRREEARGFIYRTTALAMVFLVALGAVNLPGTPPSEAGAANEPAGSPPPETAVSAEPATIAAGTARAQGRTVAGLSADEKQRAYDADVSALRQRQMRVQALIDQLPRDTIDLQALASALSTAADAFEFVRDRIALEPYGGVMKGATGTLLSRGGNALDRSLLLADLLAQKGIGVHIVGGRLSPLQSEALLRQIGNQPSALLQMSRSLPRSTAAPMLSDSARKSVETILAQAEARADELRASAIAGFDTMRSVLGTSGYPLGAAPDARQLEQLRLHYWVRATIGGQIVDFDAAFATAKRGERFTEVVEQFDPGGIPDRLHHRLTLRVVADYIVGESVSTQEIVKAEARSMDLVDASVRVVIEPRAVARAQNDFLATLTLGQVSATKPFALRQSGGTSQPAGPADLFGAFGAGSDSTSNEPVLGRLAVQITSTSPALEDARYRRVILDRLNDDPRAPALQPGSEDDEPARVLLVQIWEGAIAVGAYHPQQMLRHELETFTAQQRMMERALASRYLGEAFPASEISPPQYPRQLAEFFFHGSLAHDLLLQAEAPTVRLFHERPQLAFVRHGVVVDDWSQQFQARRFQDAVDLVNLPYGLIGPPDQTAPLRLKVGITDTSLERALARPGWDFNTIPLLAAAADQRIAIKVFAPGSQSPFDQIDLPPALKGVMLGELAMGRTLIAPAGLVALNGVRTFGWWSFDPENGVPLGQMELGVGQAAVETAKLTEATATLSHTLGKLYGGFLGCFFAAAADQLYNKGQTTVNAIPGTAAIRTGEDLGECLAHKWCEAVIEYAFLAAGVASFHHRTMLQEVLWIGLHLFGPAAVSYLACH